MSQACAATGWAPEAINLAVKALQSLLQGPSALLGPAGCIRIR